MDKPVSWKTLSSSYLLKHPYLSVRKDCRVAPGFARHDFFILEFPDWVNIVAVTDDSKAILVRQFRHGREEITLEIPGGVVDPGEEPRLTAARELAEETGFIAEDLQLLSVVSVNPAIQNNCCHLFLATGCRKGGEQALDGSESISVELVPLDDLPGLMATGQIHHSLNCLALNLALSKLTA
ncbi:MAG TPA: NUDIX hydrolase [Bacillota bacterium]|nr:NUDIX hydrolase [Bacillota bacterium]HPZ21798.1 NUDIX hydrolase [Bacillota bacterium]HQD19392.1 NUDIX hydrolase [Bacillota bacterium]